ncbi:MAG: tetratricopeptide repeat protein [Gammaproteobacteria bacterium]|nr:tetratricopeptide repeat protein [Gammaproteobacteria bacterium]
MRTTLRIALTSAWFALALMSSGPAQAQDEQQAERETRKTPAMRQNVYAELSEAQKAADANDFAGAIRILDELRDRDRLNSYELAQLWNFYGFIHYSNDDLARSIEAYENMLAQPDLAEAMQTDTLYTLAQLSFTTDQYAKAVDYLERWFAASNDPGPEPYILLGQAYYQMERFEDAIAPVETAIRIAGEQGKPVQETWYLLLRAFYFELDNFPKVVAVLEALVRHHPKKEYWVQLAAMYGETGQEQKQLVAYEIAHVQGFLTEGDELVLLAQLYLQQDVPFKAASVLDQGMKSATVEKTAANYRLLSQAWTLAQEDEKAIPALMQAARLSDDGELDARLAQTYMNLDQWDKAAEAARAALEKGVEGEAGVQLMLGMSLFNLERFEQAKSTFRLAQNDSRSGTTARQWIEHIDQEQQRLEQLERAAP